VLSAVEGGVRGASAEFGGRREHVRDERGGGMRERDVV
jgi:hypothetical protein